MQNRKIHKNNKCGFKGVYFVAKKNRYRAKVQYNGKKIHLGLHRTPERAHEAYMDWCRRNIPNFVERDDYQRAA